MPTPLPKVDSPEVQGIVDEDSDDLSAYNICLNYEEELAAFEDKLRYVRILGFLLLHAPIGVFVLKSPSVYTHATPAATSPMSVLSLNVTSSYFVNSPFATFTPCMLIYFRLVQSRSTEVARRNPANTPQGPPLRS